MKNRKNYIARSTATLTQSGLLAALLQHQRRKVIELTQRRAQRERLARLTVVDPVDQMEPHPAPARSVPKEKKVYAPGRNRTTRSGRGLGTKTFGRVRGVRAGCD